MQYYQQAADLGYSLAQRQTGIPNIFSLLIINDRTAMGYCHGRGVPKDCRKAEEYFLKAGDQGDSISYCKIGTYTHMAYE